MCQNVISTESSTPLHGAPQLGNLTTVAASQHPTSEVYVQHIYSNGRTALLAHQNRGSLLSVQK